MKQMKKLLAFVLAFAMIITIYQPSAVYAAAKKPAMSAKTVTLQAGQKKTLKVKNAGKNAILKWSSNKKAIATVSKKGVVKAVKAGNAVITCKVTTKNGKTTKLTCKVAVKKASASSVTVGSQKELEKALKNKSVRKITVATQGAVTFTVPQGDYSKVDLVINAPNADVVNNGKFKSIDIQAIKPNTYHENASGNSILFRSKDGRVVIEKNASGVSLTLAPNGGYAHFVIYGGINSITINGPAKVTIEGNVTSAVPVKFGEKAEGATVTSSIPVDVQADAKISLTLTKGAEGSKVKTADKTEVTVKNETTTAVPVTTATGTKDVSANSTTTVDANGNISETIMDNNGGGASGSGSGSSSSGSTAGGMQEPMVTPPIIRCYSNTIIVKMEPGYEYACVISGTAISAIPQSEWIAESELDPDNHFRTYEFDDLETDGDYILYKRLVNDKKFFEEQSISLREAHRGFGYAYEVVGNRDISYTPEVSTGSAFSVELDGVYAEVYGSDDFWEEEDIYWGYGIESNAEQPELKNALSVEDMSENGKVKLTIDLSKNSNWVLGDNTVSFGLYFGIYDGTDQMLTPVHPIQYKIHFRIK